MVKHLDEGVGRGNLPTSLSTLIGRHAEIRALSDLAGSARLVTIVGSGGTGKTRLALATAERSGEHTEGGSWWVDLTALAGSGLLASAVGNVLGVAPAPGEDCTAAIVAAIGHRRTLVVLDNCEQVIDECALFVDQLLRSCPALRILATSREIMGVPGERVFRMGGLCLPGAADDLRSSEAVQLFLERAMSRAGADIGATDLGAVARLCRRVDGLPLAIELAAAHVGALGVGEVAARLDEDLRLLRHPSRTAPERQQTLEAAMEWSYRLLTDSEQALLRKLSCFRGTFSLLAAEAVAAAGAGADDKKAVVLLGNLVDKSLVQVAERGAEHRYRLLHTVRQYAEAKLVGSTEALGAYRAHTRFYLQLAAQAAIGLEGPDQGHWLERLDLEHDNLRAVLRRELLADPETAGHMAALLWPFWYRRGHYDEARRWLEEVVASAPEMSPAVRAAALTGAGVLAFLQCDYELAGQRLSAVRSLHEQQGDRTGVAAVLQRLGSIAREQGRYADARRLHGQSMAVWAELGDSAGVAASEDYLAFVSWLEGAYEEAAARGERALSYFERAGRQQEAAAARVNLGAASLHAGDDRGAEAHLLPALSVSSQVGYQEGVAWSLHGLGAIAARRGQPEAADMLLRSLRAHVQLGDRWRAASVMETIGAFLADVNAASGTRLVAASHKLREQLGTPVPPAEEPAVALARQRMEASLGSALYGEKWAAGLATPLPDAVELAAAELTAMRPAPAGTTGITSDGSVHPPAPDVRFDLTPRERDVLKLVCQGLTNREIGRQLFISEGTAGVHVSSILRKLGVTSRVRAAVIARELGYEPKQGHL